MHELQHLGTLERVSAVYESKAYGFAGDNFYNLAVRLATELAPGVLVLRLREIEDRHGRSRHVPRYSPRTLDLDLLLYGDMICHDATLDVPRRDILTCAFVLRPLADIAGDCVHPETGMRLREIWDKFNRPDQETWPAPFAPLV
jgi:2-amino-4-hydroxy-6-hydroxymethyldihydropteridine diphosphokinase